MPSKNWGMNVIPPEDRIDPTKEHTCGGKPVVNLEIRLHNSTGNEVTYPVKGTVVLREKPFRTEYRIWSLDGRADVVWNNGENLVPSKIMRVSHGTR